MTFQDFHNIQSGHNVTAELFKYGLFWKLVQNFDFHRHQCKMYIIYGNATHRWYTLFQNQSYILGVCSVLSLYAVFAFQNCVLLCAETKGQICIQENGDSSLVA